MSTKEQAANIYQKHIALATTDGRLFRKTVMDEIMATMSVTLASAATLYNNAKKACPVAGLGRAELAPGVRKLSNKSPDDDDFEQEENDCYTVLELMKNSGNTIVVGRTHSYEGLGLARIKYKEMITRDLKNNWRLIQGLGPISGETWKLSEGESIIEGIDRFQMKELEGSI